VPAALSERLLHHLSGIFGIRQPNNFFAGKSFDIRIPTCRTMAKFENGAVPVPSSKGAISSVQRSHRSRHRRPWSCGFLHLGAPESHSSLRLRPPCPEPVRCSRLTAFTCKAHSRVKYTSTLRKSGKRACQPRLRRFCSTVPPRLLGQRIAPRPDRVGARRVCRSPAWAAGECAGTAGVWHDCDAISKVLILDDDTIPYQVYQEDGIDGLAEIRP
jgi:hypothetical protein